MPTALQTAIWIRAAQWMMGQCARRFGDTFSIRFAGRGTWVVLSNPADIEAVFKADPELLLTGQTNEILEPLLGPRSVLLLDGAAHLQQRKLMLPAFHGEQMGRYGELIGDIAAQEIESWERGSTQQLRPRMQALTLEVIVQAIFGVTDRRRHDALADALRNLLDMLTDPLWGSTFLALGPARLKRFPPFRRRVARVDQLIYQEISDRRREANPGTRADIMSQLLTATHDDGTQMGDDELRDELVTLLVAGHETTANALAWAGERLARHPDKLARLTGEVRAGSDVYLKATVQETLRLRPVLSSVQRVLAAPMQVAGYELPAGTTLTLAVPLVNRRPDIYANPDAFEPERFVGSAPGTYSWIPVRRGPAALPRRRLRAIRDGDRPARARPAQGHRSGEGRR